MFMYLAPQVNIRGMSFFKKPIVIIFTIIIVGGIGALIYRGATKKTVYDFVLAKKGTITQVVSITGNVKPAESVDLAFEKSGKVAAVYAKVGDKVFAGQKLVALSSGGLAADLAKAEANLAAEEAALAEMKRGTRPEEITIAETDLNNARSKADAALKEAYDAALSAANEAVVKGKNAMLSVSDLQFKYYIGNDQDSLIIADSKKVAIKTFFGVDNGGTLSTDEISKLESGIYGAVRVVAANPPYAGIDSVLIQVVDSLNKIKNLLDVIKITTSFTSTEKSDLSTQKTTIGAEISAVSADIQAIAVQKTTNTNNIAAAEAELALKKAGSTSDEITAEEAKVKSLEASVLSAKAELDKTVIIAPISGTVTRQDAKVGQIDSANVILVSLISASNFEIEANIPEADIAKVAVGNTADITLDAYGSDVRFETKVVKIDPAETEIEGVATYKTTFIFTKEDERVKSGMTANIDILTAKKENVILIPTRAVSSKNNEKFVQILTGQGPEDIIITVGLRGSDGNIEIISGVNEGDKIVTGVKK
jgi:HlyD family secretion protein